MKFKYPKKIILLGQEFKIINGKCSVKERCAEINYIKQVITLDIKMMNEFNYSIKETLWHELSHYFFQYYNLDNTEILAESLGKFITNLNKQFYKTK